MRRAAIAMLSVPMLAASAAGQAPPAVQSCAVSAFSVDPDPRGMNVRAAPNARARVLRRVVSQGSPRAEIVGASGGWFRVREIYDAETDERLFAGDGWVHHSLLGLEVAHFDPGLYAAPDRRSRVLARLVPYESRTSLLSCAGQWVQVRAGNRTGWLSPEGQCGNPLTTCS